jgi:hypothetical protein
MMISSCNPAESGIMLPILMLSSPFYRRDESHLGSDENCGCIEMLVPHAREAGERSQARGTLIIHQTNSSPFIA